MSGISVIYPTGLDKRNLSVDDRLVRRDRWPPRSPDLTPLDFYLFGSLKTEVFRNRIHTLEELQAIIVEEINNIDQHTLQRVFNNMKKRVNMTLLNNCGHIEQDLFVKD
jgi:hypothetical protein